jgi:hypothetical protein
MSDDTFRVHLKGFEAVILYPALLTPSIVGPDSCMTIVLATKEDFYKDVYLVDRENGNEIGENAAR